MLDHPDIQPEQQDKFGQTALRLASKFQAIQDMLISRSTLNLRDSRLHGTAANVRYAELLDEASKEPLPSPEEVHENVINLF